MSKIYDIDKKRWEWAQQYRYDAGAWKDVIQNHEDEAVRLSSSFLPQTYLGKGTILQRDISQMPISPNSAAMSYYMDIATPFGPNGAWGGKTSCNTSSFGTRPIHMYVVDSTIPGGTFQTFGSASTSISTPTLEINTYMRGLIPMPSWATPAANGDQGLAIYDLGTGIMREWFGCHKQADGTWGGSGGWSVNKPGLQDLATDNYALQQQRGISNVAGMHNSLGFIGIADAIRASADEDTDFGHALCFTVSSARMTQDDRVTQRISWPARLSDGKLENYLPGGPKDESATYHPWLSWDLKTPTHGTWGRLKSSVDPMYNPKTGGRYNPFTRRVIRTMKKWGGVATDTNLWCHAFNAEQGISWKHVYGEDPWKYGGLIGMLYQTDPAVSSGMDVSDFPWDQMEWAPDDWGRPSPDWNIRPTGQILPWVRP